MTPQATRFPVLLASDFPIFRESLKTYFETTAEIELVACATGRSEVIPLLHSAQPKLVLLDLDIAWEDVCSLLDEIHKNRDTRSLVLCDVVEGSRIIQALRHGANGVLPRRTTHGLFVKSIQAVLKGEFWVSRDMMSDFVHFIRQSATATNDSPRLPELNISRFGLTPRELQMVRALVEGQTNKDIAGTFGISEYTVKHHLTNVYDKLGVYNRVELVLFAINHRLCTAPGGVASLEA